MEELEYNGVWWLPDEPEKRFYGILKFTPSGGAILDLMGSFRDIKDDILKHKEYEIILGISSDGKYITLYKCFEIRSTIYVEFVFVGFHFYKPEDIKFKKIRIHYSYLDEWVGISGFEIHKRENFINIKYKLPSSFFYNISTGHYNFVLKIIFGIHGLKYSFFQKEIFIVQKTYIEIESYTSDHFWDYTKIKYNIENFLNLSIMRPVYPLSIIGITKDKQSKEVFIEIYYRSPDPPKVFKPLIPYEMLFTFVDIKDKFGKFLENWLKVYNKLEPYKY